MSNEFPLDMHRMRQLRAALNCLTSSHEHFDIRQLDDLGYDTYKFGPFGQPTQTEIKEKCCNIIYEAIDSLNDAIGTLSNQNKTDYY